MKAIARSWIVLVLLFPLGTLAAEGLPAQDRMLSCDPETATVAAREILNDLKTLAEPRVAPGIPAHHESPFSSSTLSRCSAERQSLQRLSSGRAEVACAHHPERWRELNIGQRPKSVVAEGYVWPASARTSRAGPSPTARTWRRAPALNRALPYPLMTVPSYS
jgi:hypothetical protein